jgi:hypothetical protein
MSEPTEERPQPATPLGFVGELGKLKRRTVRGELDARVAWLRQWQMRRLARTYADLLDEPRFAPACRFFLDDIYAARDFSQRDEDMKTMYTLMRRFVPEPVIHPLALTVRLHEQTERLDSALLDALLNQVKAGERLTIAEYAEAYRLCDNYADRVTQIEWIVEIGQELERIVKLPLTGTALALARAPARRAGYDELAGFLERGYKAFKHMRGAAGFLGVIQRRERQALDRMYAHHPDPFGFGADVAVP